MAARVSAAPYKMAAPWAEGAGLRGVATAAAPFRSRERARAGGVTSAGGHVGAQDHADRQGFAPSTAGFGPLRDLPDWSFVDGRPAPLWKGQLRRLQENEALARRAVKLSQVLEAAASRGEPGGAAAPRLRPKGSQCRPVRTSADQ
ncbi:large ribosomal subunit protein mL52 isoform X1 [Phalacrocorax carbo]|uniref:large ribosomal subunit protein mL52 isoform X1 n=1 Tax=Phalacrocorax carbo TaxID=9209 RepID=UPI003119A83A